MSTRLQKLFEVKSFETENLIVTPTPKKGNFKLTVKNKLLLITAEAGEDFFLGTFSEF